MEETVIDITSCDLTLYERHIGCCEEGNDRGHQEWRHGHRFTGKEGHNQRRCEGGSRDSNVHRRRRAQDRQLQGDGFRQEKIQESSKGGTRTDEWENVASAKATCNREGDSNEFGASHNEDFEGGIHFEPDQPRGWPDVW